MPYQLNPDRYFSVNLDQRKMARSLYESVKDLPIISPHGHVDPALFSRPDATFGSPTDLFIIPDHYVFRMLYSQGIPLESLGIPRIDGGPVEQDHRKIWQIFADHYYLFQGTPSGGWIDHALYENLGVQERLDGKNAQEVYDHIQHRLNSPEFQPRQLLSSLNIEVLCTTDAATDTLSGLQTMRSQGFGHNIYPTFRPDALINICAPDWLLQVEQLAQVSGIDVVNYDSFIQALQQTQGIFQTDGRTCHRSRRDNRLHQSSLAIRGGSHLPPCSGRRGFTTGRDRFHRPYVDRDGAHVYRRWSGDADPCRRLAQSQPVHLPNLRP
jgi:glucuronate isomerase